MGLLLAIDPGNTQSAYATMDGYHVGNCDKVKNECLLEIIGLITVDTVAIEMVESYGMAVGKEVFETCVWIGRFCQAAIAAGCNVKFVTRKAVKLNLCGSHKAKDANIRRALIDRFAKHDLARGTGTKKSPDWFYGFAADMWAAYAVGVTYLDTENTQITAYSPNIPSEGYMNCIRCGTPCESDYCDACEEYKRPTPEQVEYQKGER